MRYPIANLGQTMLPPNTAFSEEGTVQGFVNGLCKELDSVNVLKTGRLEDGVFAQYGWAYDFLEMIDKSGFQPDVVWAHLERRCDDPESRHDLAIIKSFRGFPRDFATRADFPETVGQLQETCAWYKRISEEGPSDFKEQAKQNYADCSSRLQFIYSGTALGGRLGQVSSDTPLTNTQKFTPFPGEVEAPRRFPTWGYIVGGLVIVGVGAYAATRG